MRYVLALMLLCLTTTSSPLANAEPEIQGGYFAVVVSDIDISEKWYSTVFDLTTGSRLSEDGRYIILNLQKPGLFVELLELATAQARPESIIEGPFKLGVLVDDLAGFVAGLPDSIVPPDIVDDANNNLLLVQLRDPDGSIIQVMEVLRSTQPGD